ncbi:MAG: DUF998 domain-containing protein [Hyphomicrobiales bacterium]|nr:DUF998 domain-containing protein [Hyphomicrobiales bacterium]
MRDKHVIDPNWVKLALLQGIIAPVLFTLTAILGGLLHPGYSHYSQAISELTEAGATNRFYLSLSLLMMELLTILFAVGFFSIWQIATAIHLLRIRAGIIPRSA